MMKDMGLVEDHESDKAEAILFFPCQVSLPHPLMKGAETKFAGAKSLDRFS